VSVLSPIEIASGLVLGNTQPLEPVRGADPRAAMERALLDPLRRGPCVVSFSGGRDSSAVLAVATAVARREGLQPPIPATLRFPNAADSTETEWQETVIAHLGLHDWIRLEVTDELDCVGPVASASLARHGLLWPSNAHFHAPLFERARGGSFLTGIGGDELLGSSRWFHARRVLAGKVVPRPRDVFAVPFALAPPRLRRPVTRRRVRAPFPWLHDHVVEQLERWLANDEAAEPFGWRGGIVYSASHRYLHVGTRSLAVLAAAEDVKLVHPFLEPGFVSALATLPRADRFDSRRGAMDAIFGDVLPADVRSRRTKASFDGAFWHEHSREFVARWAGDGVDPTLVDVERLRAQWESGAPDPRTYTLLQSVKLALDLPASVGENVEQPASRLVEAIPATRPAELPAG
jgi:asparagine synthetase B (glutamine-hydrolysing)